MNIEFKEDQFNPTILDFGDNLGLSIEQIRSLVKFIEHRDNHYMGTTEKIRYFIDLVEDDSSRDNEIAFVIYYLGYYRK